MTNVDEPARHAMYNALIGVIGTEDAGTLMELLPKSRWEDVVTKPYLDMRLDELRSETRSEFASVRSELTESRSETRSEFAAVRSELTELRSESRSEFAAVRSESRSEFDSLRIEIADLRVEVHTAMRTQLVWMIGTMIALSGFVIAATSALQ